MDGDFFNVEAIREKRVVQYSNLRESRRCRQGNPMTRAMVDEEGMRILLVVPLLRGDHAIGCIILIRKEEKLFSEDEIALVETFAAQAVNAIENVRQFREVQTRLERERASREILSAISRSRDDATPVFETLLEAAKRLCGTSNGAIVLGEEGGGPQVLAAETGASQEIRARYSDGGFPMDPERSQAALAIVEKRTIHVPDLANSEYYRDDRYVTRHQVDVEGIASSIFVPLISGGKGIGCINLLHKDQRTYTEDEIALVEGFAAQAVIAIENMRQFKALERLNAELGDRVEAQVAELDRMGRLKRFLPAQVADAVVSRGDDILSSHRALIATLFCDMRSFTAFCERAEPEETIEVLQTYHEDMGRLLSEYGAGVEHRLGDGIMAMFNDPLPCDDPAGDAVRLALAMRARMEELCKGWKRLGHRLGFGVGVSLGYATVGMVDSEGRYEYTAIGTAVNLASRLCDEAEDGETLISPRAATAIEDDFELADHGEVTLKGIQDAVPVHRVVGPRA